MATLIYLAIGFVVSIFNNFIYSKIQTNEQAKQEEPAMVLAMFIWYILWPIGLISSVVMLRRLTKQRY